MKSAHASSKLERKTVERNRRMHMKSLCFKLASLLSNHHSKEALSQQDQLEQAAVHIKNLQEKIQELKSKRDLAMRVEGINQGFSDGMTIGLRLPMVEVKDLGSSLEVVLISGLYKKFTFCDVISVLEEEGVEVVNANFSVVGDKIFHIIHAQVKSSRVGFESGRVYQKLKELVH
ncbi:transcription factor bHLH162-like [Aristolochia californica]|uniref:transcription factor bHLH162-like n=1 Tax=Aristolochia californica TaxID=171875 RepID=UPI0035E069A5